MAATDERKPVTVLFADLAGSTELATHHDPEHLRALLSAFFDEMRQQIESYGGTVEKYAGDAILAVFGVPQVHEDDAERAVRAALAMRDSLAQLNPMFEQEYGVRLALRIGIATGEDVAAATESREFLVTGEVPNLAARLQSVADGIVLSEETYRLVAPILEAEPTGPHILKGFTEPVTARRVVGLRAVEARPRGIPGLSSPVVGRDAEMTALRSSVEDLRRGRGQVVSIVGEAGIGKTRVKIELRDNLSAGVRWLEGRCQSYTQSTSYTPIIEILRSALGLGTAETPAIARTKLRVALRALAGERAEQVVGALAHLLGVDLGPGAPTLPPDPRALQSQLVLAARAILEGLAQRGPVIVVIEDLHWADAASLELLTMLLELTDFQPLLVLVTSRPEAEGEAWTFRLHAERYYRHRFSELRLLPLGAGDSERLADNLLRVSDLPDAIRRRMLDRAEGNPFFLEEVIRALIEQGMLRRDGERFIFAGDAERWPIPTTLRGVLAARIDRLPGHAKGVMQRASVVGRFFEYRTLRAIDDEPDELDRTLPHLLRAELIREWTRHPERQYVFKHALTHEAAYASMLTEYKKALHARVARHLEERLGEGSAEHAAALAHHWDHAEDRDRALHYTLRAAERARDLYARPEALAHYRRALELLRLLPSTDEHRLAHADVAIVLPQIQGWAPDRSALEAGLREMEHAAEYLRGRGDAEGRLLRLEALRGVIEMDEALPRHAVQRAQELGDPLTEAFTAEHYGHLLGRLGHYERTLALFARAIEIHAARGDRLQQALNMNFGGRCYSARAGALDRSLQYAAGVRTIAEELNDVRLRALRGMEAEPYYYKGLWEDVVRVAEESLPIAWEIWEGNVLFTSAWLGLAYLKLGRRGDARRVIGRALREGEVRYAGTPFALSYLTIARVLTDLADGELESALALAPKALDLAERSRFALERGAAHRALALVHEVAGGREAAESAFRGSLEILEGIQSRPELGQTLLAYGRFTLARAPGDGRRLIERARAIFGEIGATGWLAEAEEALRA